MIFNDTISDGSIHTCTSFIYLYTGTFNKLLDPFTQGEQLFLLFPASACKQHKKCTEYTSHATTKTESTMHCQQ